MLELPFAPPLLSRNKDNLCTIFLLRARAKEIARTWAFRRLHNLFRPAPRPRSVTPINIIGLLERPYHAKMVLPSDFLLPDADGTDSKRR